jgi:FAD synthase
VAKKSSVFISQVGRNDHLASIALTMKPADQVMVSAHQQNQRDTDLKEKYKRLQQYAEQLYTKNLTIEANRQNQSLEEMLSHEKIVSRKP